MVPQRLGRLTSVPSGQGHRRLGEVISATVWPRWRDTTTIVLLGLAFAGNGCGGARDSFVHQATAQNLRDCLAISGSARHASVIDQSVLSRVPGARGGVEVSFGGPTDHNGTIAEIPVLVDTLYLFGDARAAARAAPTLRAAPGHATVEVIASVAVSHTVSFLVPPTRPAPISPGERNPIRKCLAATHFLR